MGKESVVHLHIRDEKTMTLEFFMQMDGIRKHYPEGDNSDPPPKKNEYGMYSLISGY